MMFAEIKLGKPDMPRQSAANDCNRDRKLSERSASAAQKVIALGEMTAGIAHDFRNVLCIVASGLRIAESDGANPAKLKLAMAAIQDGLDRGLRMTSRLLAFARQQELSAQPEDVNALLEKLKMFLKYGAGPGIRVVLELAADLPTCLVDPPQFNAAILNLVVNSRDAMTAGGTITISSASFAGEPSPVGTRDYVRVRVRDDGVGMTPDVVDQIFDPYFTTKGEDGTGLGVPQVQALMHKIGGYVAVESAAGIGTAIDLFFPVQDERLPLAADALPQLDRWANEGGAIGRQPIVTHAAASEEVNRAVE